MATRVSLVTLGCARNEVDSEELAARFAAAGLELVAEPADADAVVVNTCGFVASAKKDSIDTLLAAADLKGDGGPRAVVAVGCLAQRYGEQLAAELPEADAVLGFDAYPTLAATVQQLLDSAAPPGTAPPGTAPPGAAPPDRRLLPLLPAEPPEPVSPQGSPPSALSSIRYPVSGPSPVRHRLDDAPVAPLKIASGCDRRCTFCAIPSFRGGFASRRPTDILDEARWLAAHGVSELFCVSENSTSYGKDLGDIRLLETLLPELAAVAGVARVRLSYLQPAELRPSLVDVLSGTPGVAPYFDLSFQHASGPVLKRMRRFGDADRFLELIASVRSRAPHAGIRSNVIVGFPGETEADLAELERFLVAARLDVVGVFGYSDEDGTEAERLDGKLPETEIARRVSAVSALVEQLTAQRAEDRVGERVEVLVEEVADGVVTGRAAHQGPEVDGTTTVTGVTAAVGRLVPARVVAADGVDLLAEAVA